MNSPEEHGNGPVINDRRRIDPVTGQVREPDRPRGKHAASQPGGNARGGGADAQGARQGQGPKPEGSAPGPEPETPQAAGNGPAAEEQPGRPPVSGGTG